MLNFGQERLLVTKFSIFPLLFCPKYHVQLFVSAFLPHTAVWAMDHLWASSMPLWENPHPNFNYNLIVMWKALIVNGFWWNLNMLFILVVSNSLGNLFEINQSLLNCCVVKKVAFVISRSCSAPRCGEYLRDLALFDQLLYNGLSTNIMFAYHFNFQVAQAITMAIRLRAFFLLNLCIMDKEHWQKLNQKDNIKNLWMVFTVL